MSNYIEQEAEATEADQSIRAHLRQACEHKIALHVDAAIDVVDTDPEEADAWAYEAGKEAWEFDLPVPEKLASHPALSAAFKRGFESVEQQSRSHREVQGNVTGNEQWAEAAKKILGLDSKGRAFQWADELVELVNQLSAEYESWCKEQKVPYIRMDDLDAKGYYLTQAQRVELAKFRERWNALEQARVDSSNRSASMKMLKKNGNF